MKAVDNAEVPDLKAIVDLKTVLRNAPKRKLSRYTCDDIEWTGGDGADVMSTLSRFMEEGGLDVLSRGIRRRLVSMPRTSLDVAVCMELLDCFKGLMNNADTMEKVLGHIYRDGEAHQRSLIGFGTPVSSGFDRLLSGFQLVRPRHIHT